MDLIDEVEILPALQRTNKIKRSQKTDKKRILEHNVIHDPSNIIYFPTRNGHENAVEIGYFFDNHNTMQCVSNNHRLPFLSFIKPSVLN
ncbi:CLUMA_CG006770, isoform A [Clunio marinus]|uniref:CLUMA_CG006770, isoform A n=1 Tax=Clunio marinus TaxID=568069 RepID=A0A1J1I0C3_9DIPT|nr:CLUMA_CG006770, isoform A [Clunio marinus]